MWIKRELDISDLDNFFWSGAKRNWNNATDAQKERVWDYLEMTFADDMPTDTEVNDIVWFEWDSIAGDDDEEEADESFSHRRYVGRKSRR